ncbi:hypothetical protein QBC34DRAFT_406498 [Podospora aff. communis PSN243]|uniref:G domain-containing protein n=1 Tax=Podospora aff. communis PSN243 TaxID=3040156 RepID=A0AAV9GM03_9PEZI|nr:hypothetical protein QBC34DRAFT_406498 [Podospora aff. communis PSN243]
MQKLGIVVLMGMTGAGKSTFISRLKTSDHQIHIGQGLESKTTDLAVYEARTPNDPRRRLLLADTPGFNDTVRSDTDVLRSIVVPLYQLHKNGHPILGIIYLHNITNSRLAGTALKMLRVLQQLCGMENFGRIIFATTMWEDASFTPQGRETARGRHQELSREFWNDMFPGNGGVVQHLRDDRASAGDVLGHFLTGFAGLRTADQERLMQVFDEMDHGRLFEQTSGYSCIYEERRLLRQQKEQQLAELEKQRHQLHQLQLKRKAENSGESLAFGSFYEVSPNVNYPSEGNQAGKDSRALKLRRYASGRWEKVKSLF